MTRQLAPIAGMIPIVLLIAADVTESLVAAGPGREVGSAVAASVRSWGVWLLLAPAIGAWDSALERRARGVRFAAHGVALVAATIVHLLLHARPRLRDDADVSGVVALEIGMATVLYVLVVAARGLVQRAATAREREFATARQEAADARIAQLADAARLSQLYAQLQPHFLFNALNGASALVLRGESERAVTAISRIGRFLRRTLDLQGQLEIPLADELTMLEEYIAIERERIGPRLATTVHVDPACADAAVPPLILQPLVENAVHHAFTDPRTSTIDVRARRLNGTLCIEVCDDGPGITASAPQGVGLANARERLLRQYGVDASLEVTSTPTGTVASLRLPFRPPANAGDGSRKNT